MPTAIAHDVYAIAEAACDRGSGIQLRLFDGQTFSGTAVDIQSADGAEFLALQGADRRLLIRLTAVASMELRPD